MEPTWGVDEEGIAVGGSGVEALPTRETRSRQLVENKKEKLVPGGGVEPP
jgi:hypothetical protein